MYRLGIDTGGTFTDGVLVDSSGQIRIFKAPTTPEDFSVGVMDCIGEAAKGIQCTVRDFLKDVEVIAHGTTITTNACIVSSGARVGLITTKGFRDILELRRGMRPAHYYRKTGPAPVLCPRYLREEVEERVLSSGEIHTPLNEEEVVQAVERLIKHGVEAIAISLLFSFLNPTHENRIAAMIAELYPDIHVSVSSDVLPQVREYERTSTTVLDAYVGPVLTRYLSKVHDRLTGEGFTGEFLVMQSNGGVHRWDTALRKPVGSIHSGPAAAYPASLFFADASNSHDVLSVDMGGTSFDVGLIKDRTINTTTDGWVGLQRNATPMVDVHAIGAGGGSIAWIDPNGILRVGPKSAGSVPGPACYRKGGTAPTVTDANLVLGYLNPDNFWGGKLPLDRKAAAEALEVLAKDLKIDTVDVASAIYHVINENMINAINLAAIRRGYDPQGFLLIVGGGTGAIHSAGLAKQLKINKILVPKESPVYCAFGLLLSDLKHDYVQSFITPLHKADCSELNAAFQVMERQGRETLEEEGIAPEDITFRRTADMRYIGQFKEISVGLPSEDLSESDISLVEQSFSERHQQLFSFSDEKRGLELLTLKVEAVGKVPKVTLYEHSSNDGDSSKAIKGVRNVYFAEERGFLETNIYDGDLLKPGNIVKGPAIVEETVLTLVIPPDLAFHVDRYGNYSSE